MRQSTKYLKILCNLLFAAAIVLFLVFAAPRLIAYFAPFAFGFVLSLIANPIVHFLEKRIRIKRKFGSALIIILTIGVIVLACYGVTTALLVGVSDFLEYVPTILDGAIEEFQEASRHLEDILHLVPFAQGADLDKVGDEIGIHLRSWISSAGSTTVSAMSDMVARIPDILVGVVMGLMATYFFIAEHNRIMGWFSSNMPESFQKSVSHFYGKLVHAVGGYFKAQFQIMCVIYVVLLVGFLILKVKYAWLIGLAVAFLDMLPIFGTGTVLIPWALIKLLSGNIQSAAGMLILYAVSLVTHQLVQPKLVGDSIGLDPFASLFFMFIGFKSGGVLGMILAVPIGMILINLYELGAFDTLIWCFKEIIRDFNEFRKVPRE